MPAPENSLLVALRAYLNKRPHEALAVLQHYDQPTQELLLSCLPFLAQLAAGIEDLHLREASDLLCQMHRLEDSLRGHADLQIEKMMFCKGIKGFGLVQPLEAGHLFEAGQGGKSGESVKVYAELVNCTSKRNGPWHETWWAGQLEIRDINHKLVSQTEVPARPDRSCSPRQDFFIRCDFCVPSSLQPGRYTLTLQIQDRTMLLFRETRSVAGEQLQVPRHRVASATLDFVVTAPRTVRGVAPEEKKEHTARSEALASK